MMQERREFNFNYYVIAFTLIALAGIGSVTLLVALRAATETLIAAVFGFVTLTLGVLMAAVRFQFQHTNSQLDKLVEKLGVSKRAQGQAEGQRIRQGRDRREASRKRVAARARREPKP